MDTQLKIWNTINSEYERYKSLRLNEMKDYDKFYLYSLIAHSTAIEGSTLTENEARLLFDDGLTAKSRPVAEYLMNLDLKNAYEFALSEAPLQHTLTPKLLQTMNAMVMKNTGGIHHVAAGTFDVSRGEYRLCGVTAGFGGKSYMDFRKVAAKVDELCNEINRRLPLVQSVQEIYNLSFDAHLNLVNIHPWLDGNGRTSRLLMNYIQVRCNVAPAKVYRKDRAAYIASLSESCENEDNLPFRHFMGKQLLKTLREEIRNAEKNRRNTVQLLF